MQDFLQHGLKETGRGTGMTRHDTGMTGFSESSDDVEQRRHKQKTQTKEKTVTFNVPLACES